jgi:phospholipid-translocating ATPase
LAVTLFREGVDDIRRWQRDEEVNSQKYKRLIRGKDHNIGTEYVSSSKLKVGDLVSYSKYLFIFICNVFNLIII